jgi:tryptophan-rich sensory protein
MRLSTLITSTASVAAVAGIGSRASRPSVESDWYARLRKPRFQPPRAVFPVAWSTLYSDIAVVSAATVDELRGTGDARGARAYLIALGVNLALNGSWSWLFFNRHRLGASAVVAAALTVSSADLTRRAVAARGVRGVPLALYPLWCAFATVLSTDIWRLNRSR